MTPSRIHNTLIVGVGSIGERHVRCFQATGRANVAICDADVDLLREVAQRYRIRRADGDFATALDNTLDAVVIATPADTHISLAIQAAQSHLHLLIEKPLCTHGTDVDQLVRLVEQNGCTAMVAYVLRAHPSLRAMRDAIVTGRFGTPVHLYATCGQHFPTYRPAYRDIYYRDRATGGGAIQDALTHVVNAAQWLVGPVHSMVADAEHRVLEGVDVEDTVNVLARHGDVMAVYGYNQHQAPNEFSLTVSCEKGTARFEYHRARWRWMTQPDTPWQDESVADFQRDAIFVRQAHAFLDAVEGKQPPLCTIDEAFQTMQANLAALKSMTDKTKWKQTGAMGDDNG